MIIKKYNNTSSTSPESHHLFFFQFLTRGNPNNSAHNFHPQFPSYVRECLEQRMMGGHVEVPTSLRGRINCGWKKKKSLSVSQTTFRFNPLFPSLVEILLSTTETVS